MYRMAFLQHILMVRIRILLISSLNKFAKFCESYIIMPCYYLCFTFFISLH